MVRVAVDLEGLTWSGAREGGGPHVGARRAHRVQALAPYVTDEDPRPEGRVPHGVQVASDQPLLLSRLVPGGDPQVTDPWRRCRQYRLLYDGGDPAHATQAVLPADEHAVDGDGEHGDPREGELVHQSVMPAERVIDGREERVHDHGRESHRHDARRAHHRRGGDRRGNGERSRGHVRRRGQVSHDGEPGSPLGEGDADRAGSLGVTWEVTSKASQDSVLVAVVVAVVVARADPRAGLVFQVRSDSVQDVSSTA